MKIAIVGSRKFNDYELLKNVVKDYIVQYNGVNITIVSGGAKGADTLAEHFAKEFDFEMKIFHPDWEQLGRDACSARNTQIVAFSDIVFAFWDGTSPGTKDSITKAKQMKKKLIITQYNNI
jgi:hypothetical protein